MVREHRGYRREMVLGLGDFGGVGGGGKIGKIRDPFFRERSGVQSVCVPRTENMHADEKLIRGDFFANYL